MGLMWELMRLKTRETTKGLGPIALAQFLLKVLLLTGTKILILRSCRTDQEVLFDGSNVEVDQVIHEL